MSSVWRCPACARRVPNHIVTCRCGLTLTAAEFSRLTSPVALPEEAASSAGTSREILQKLAALAFGYPDGFVAGWSDRVFQLALAGVAVLAVFVPITHGNGLPVPARENIKVLTRLDEFTRSSDRSVANTIPAFVALPGDLGLLRDAPPDRLDVSAPRGSAAAPAPQPHAIEFVSSFELQKGVCSSNLARLVRHRYPGSYEDFTDAELERRVIKTHPEYRQIVCWLPTWIGAEPHEIVKYYGRFRPAPSGGTLTLGWRLGLAAGFVLLALNVYYRGVVRLRTPAQG